MEYSIIPKLDNLELQQLATKSVLELSYQIELCDEEIYQIKVNSLFLKEIASKNQCDLEYYGFQSEKQLRSYLDSNHLDVLYAVGGTYF